MKRDFADTWGLVVVRELLTAIALCPGTKHNKRLMEAVSDGGEYVRENEAALERAKEVVK